MDWPIDKTTQTAARQFPLLANASAPRAQYGGRSCDPARWRNVLPPGAVFAAPRPEVLPDSPDMIISDFAAGQYLQALARTISWGAMWRRRNDIYRDHDLEHIRKVLASCADSIGQTHSIHQSWELLTGDAGLQWSSVMASKVLHFLCRALGIRQDPPVPIDGAVIRQRVWPAFRNIFIEGELRREMYPGNWNGNGFSAYCRYMTAIVTWAEVRNWTTTEAETTIFGEYR